MIGKRLFSSAIVHHVREFFELLLRETVQLHVRRRYGEPGLCIEEFRNDAGIPTHAGLKEHARGAFEDRIEDNGYSFTHGSCA